MTVLNTYKFICIETKSHISHIYRQCMVSICDKISIITDILYISIYNSDTITSANGSN